MGDRRPNCNGRRTPPRSRAQARLCALARASCGRLAACPHLLQIIEGADLGPENMDDDIARIDEHPVAMRRALDARRKTGLVEVLHDPVGDRSDMTIRSAGGHDHVVGDGGLAAKIQSEGVLGLHVIKAREDEAKRLLSVRTDWGDGVGRTACASPRESSCGQGSFPFGSWPGRRSGHIAIPTTPLCRR